VFIAPGDSIHVRDFRNTFSVFSPDLKFVRSFQAPRELSAALPLGDGTYVISADFRKSDLAGMPLHMMNANGTLIRSFGATGKPITRTSRPELPWIARSSDPSTFYAQVGYQIEHWSTSGRLLSSHRVESVPWLPSKIEYKTITVTGRGISRSGQVPTNVGRGIVAGIDQEGLLWMNVAIPSRNDTTVTVIIEVFDPKAGVVIASLPSRKPLLFVPGTSLAWTTSEDASGVVSYSVWSIRLRRQ
jgi:hypothetical protein